MLRDPPSRLIAVIILSLGVFLAVVSAIMFMFASAYYNVGMAGPIPGGWYTWVVPACQLGELGFVMAYVGLLLLGTVFLMPPRKTTRASSGRSRGLSVSTASSCAKALSKESECRAP